MLLKYLVFIVLCSSNAIAVAANICTSLGASYYYRVTHTDGQDGFFVQEINHEKTQCADGSWQQECHIFQLDASALAWNWAQTDAYLRSIFGQQRGIVRGHFSQALEAQTATPPTETLTIMEAWQAQGANSVSDLVYHVKNNGTVCTSSPCITDTTQQLLNLWKVKDKIIAGVSLHTSTATSAQLNEGYKQLAHAGILVAGKHQFDPTTKKRLLTASQFYLPRTYEGQACTLGGNACSEGQVCNLNTTAACGDPSASGTCLALTSIHYFHGYFPECGCDGVTYGNGSARLAGGVQLNHTGECLAPSH